ncbi:MAG TPA: AMP-binding protein [Candidatus Paceibacterota bacterium]|nr:AMP-binding protein [Verrucomicrobiota bacterium]HRY50700.1 AMP-binding protein [Candidatus Paceibacterota bacterium]HSA00740.1 AMP-binding protein [Candidatus Paceibacterota bacterium]
MKPVALRIFLWLFCRTSYRVKVLDAGNVPAQGGALLVSNHISFLDMLLVLAGSQRFVHFLLPQEVYDIAWLKPFLRYLRVTPLPPESQPRELICTIHKARNLIARGELVGIFAERSISRIGVTLPFRREFERIMEGLTAPIIPVCLDGVWGSIFSYQRRRFLWKIPDTLRRRVTVSFGKPLPSSASAFEVRSAIQELNTEAWAHRRDSMRTLHRSFVRRARRSPLRFAMADARVPRLTFGGALIKVVFLARRLRAPWAGQEMVGILLPPSVAGALVNHAALLMGKVPVNLNYTLSEEPLASCIRQCNLESVITSQVFLDRVKVKVPVRILLLEEVAARPGLGEKLLAFVLAWFTAMSVLEKAVGRKHSGSLDDLATIIFSSGSTGEPKGVMLTHYNIASNATQLSQLLDFSPRDRFLGILPFFHSFGFTATLTASAAMGIGVAYHPTPLEAKPIGELVRRYALTYVIATPTFLQIYLRGCQPADFGSVRAVMASAEKLPTWLANAFEEKFGVRPMEGYGCTECSPVVTCSTHDFRAAGFRQAGSRPGSIGRQLPGVSVRIVDPDTGEPVPAGKPGLLLVRGPNVMRGYLGQPEKTAEVIKDGWYTTGDIASVDEDGFLRITDRLSRFSKIGGEMVPHVKIEDKLHEALGTSEIVFAVCGLPDPKQGEKLVVLHTLPEQRIAELLKKLPQLGLPNLWIPRPNLFFHVDALPLLATGKRDLRSVRQLAAKLAENAAPTGCAGENPEVL